MAEDTQPNQGGNINETIQQVQQGTVQQTQQPTIERKQYGPLVEPAPDAFPLHYRSPYTPGPVANGAAATPEPPPAVNPGQSGAASTTTSTTGSTSTQQQREGS